MSQWPGQYPQPQYPPQQYGAAPYGGFPPPPPPKRKRLFGGLFGWILFIALAVMLIMLTNKGSTQYASIPLSTFQDQLHQDKVRFLTIEGNRIVGEFVSPQTINGMSIVKFQTSIPTEAAGWSFTQWILDNRGNAVVEVENSQNLLLNIVLPLVPWLLIFGFIWFFVFRQLRRQPQTPYAWYPPPQPPPTAPPAPPASS